MGSQRVKHDEQLNNSNRRQFHTQRISPRPPSREWPGDRGVRRRLISCPVCQLSVLVAQPLSSSSVGVLTLFPKCDHCNSGPLFPQDLYRDKGLRSGKQVRKVYILERTETPTGGESQNCYLLEPDTGEACSKCWKDGESKRAFCLNYRCKNLNRDSYLIHSFLILKNQIKN